MGNQLTEIQLNKWPLSRSGIDSSASVKRDALLCLRVCMCQVVQWEYLQNYGIILAVWSLMVCWLRMRVSTTIFCLSFLIVC